MELARGMRKSIYGSDVYIRGLIEFSSYCRCDCYYCGLRRSNPDAQRYRLDKDDILVCCDEGYELGFRTFVMQSGEDMYFSAEKIADIVFSIKNAYPDCAVTLSVGERPRETYALWRSAGADRYLLRHETASRSHYGRLHPKEQLFDDRMRCLYDLKEIGFQTGCGFMVGSPYQTVQDMAGDLVFISDFSPDMVGIGPFIPHNATPFCEMESGSVRTTLMLLSIIRLMLPDVLLPATTALGTLDPHGREKGILAGANVLMPNLSPSNVRKKYLLYDNKICTGDEAAECISCMKGRMERIGYRIVTDRGDKKNRK